MADDISYLRLGEAMLLEFKKLSQQRLGSGEFWEKLARYTAEQLDARRQVVIKAAVKAAEADAVHTRKAGTAEQLDKGEPDDQTEEAD